MRTRGWVLVAVLAAAVPACGGDDAGDDSGEAGDGSPSDITVVIGEDTSPIAPLTGVSCRRGDNDQLIASGVVASKGDASHYVNLQVRFVDGDGVRVELATDSVSDLLVGERARWDATTYTADAAEVRRCEVTATVS